MGHLNNNDRAFLKKLKEENILEDVDSHKLDQTNGVIMISCADGDQMPDIFKKQSEYILSTQGIPRIHVLALNGGPLSIPKDSPLNNELPNGDVLLSNLGTAMELKKINTIALYNHAPCGAAGIFNISIPSVIDSLVLAKERVKTKFANAKVACFFHVDWGNNHKRTYFISAKKWKQKRSKNI